MQREVQPHSGACRPKIAQKVMTVGRRAQKGFRRKFATDCFHGKTVS
jgi:hypothetical protein